MNKENVKKFNESQNVDAKAAKVREKLENESLDKCKVAGGKNHAYNKILDLGK